MRSPFISNLNKFDPIKGIETDNASISLTNALNLNKFDPIKGIETYFNLAELCKL